MEFYCGSKYLVIPVNYHAQNKRLCFYIEGELVYDLVAAVDAYEPDEKFYVNMERFMGKTIQVTAEPEVWFPMEMSDTNVDGKGDYYGKYRPLAHFTAKRGWLNDPNGLLYYQGKYLMFYQHNPVACTWENMHWGYAVSTDLLHWKEKEIVLYPDQDGTMFSGSAVIDQRNVTGLKENENDVILLFYTCAGSTSETAKAKPFTQCLAYSTDGGETFRKYDKNPLIHQIAPGNRDPKVLYYAPTDSYIMVLYLDNYEYAFYSSKNMLDWNLFQRITIPDEIECPDFYSLPVDGDRNQMKWVFIGAADKYLIGDFDGTKFSPTSKAGFLNYGNNSYAAQSWSNMPDGRRVRTSCASVVVPGMPFGGCMSVPQEMSLKTVDGEIVLCAAPVSEIKELYGRTDSAENIQLQEGEAWREKTDSKACDIDLRIRAQDGAGCTVSLFGLDLTVDFQKKELKCLDKIAKVHGNGSTLDLRILIDTVYAEIFAGAGDVFMGMTYIQDRSLNELQVKAQAGSVCIEKMELAELKAFYE